jgi:hypothetical protein
LARDRVQDDGMFQEGDNADSGRENYAAPSPARPATVPFEAAVQLLCPWTNSTQPGLPRAPGRYQRIVELLERRAQYGAIHGWRFGRRTPPQWAKDLLASHLEREAQERWQAAAALRANEKSAR